ncbi:MAG: DUF2164 domain-containing protein [Paraburkholderia sp.]|uniref:DUF2164 domain-containing protein n=1 Tax=Paraburkholderia sp. TaxID=1926495 RepID=UPI00121C2787|nr:DUF2164 domain-containing protein [Paraburkholderia sp.]TAM05466.1 MAG: DUF2164 domain-containing protein [Paraburkholderia sp.]TAM27898.1 MAG: DUF2164 domain-containing protein [Paraburkholderia sp.]
MSIELPEDARRDAIASIQRYFDANMEEPIGNIAAQALLGFFLEEIAPSVYNKAVADAQESMQARIVDLDIDLHEAPFQYWRKYAQPKRRK